MSLQQSNDKFGTLLAYLKASRGFDFTGYKRASLTRRVDKRMQTVGVVNYDEYTDYLEMHPAEFSELFNTILINVTDFFRDAPAWDYLRTDVIPQMLARKEDWEPIRIWCAGCATGEEAYTIVMLLAEALGLPAFRERVKIYATDVDEHALGAARAATYVERQMQQIPPDLLEKYFDRVGDAYVFNKELRRYVIFGRNDLVQDAPISRVDLLSCRNTLMYFNTETQARILSRFHFGLRDSGYLLLGKAEMLFTHAYAFTTHNLKHRVFTRVAKPNLRELVAGFSIGVNGREERANTLDNHIALREAAFQSASGIRVVLDSASRLIAANDRARAVYSLTESDLGRPATELEFFYRPLDLRPCLEQVFNAPRPVTFKDIPWPTASGEGRWMEAQVTPLLDNETVFGFSVHYTDVTIYRRLHEELETSTQNLETAQEELQSAVEELETTNEELQSTIEELETTNEELQSTNEELETMNEEVQSTNEELQSINEEFRHSSVALNQSNAFLESILTSLRSGVAVVDSEARALIWNRQAEELWGLRKEEAIGKNFLMLDIGLPMESLREPLRACLRGESDYQETTLEAVNRRGKPLLCKVICAPLLELDKTQRGAIIVMEGQTEGRGNNHDTFGESNRMEL